MCIFDMFAPKKKKKNHAPAIIAGVVAALALVPVAVSINDKKKEWGFAALLYSVTRRRVGDKSEITVTIPGIGFIIKCWRRLIRLFNIGVATRRAVRAEAYDIGDFDIDFDGEAADPEVVIAAQD